MATPPISDDILQATVAAFEQAGRNQTHTAQALGLSRGGLQTRLHLAARRGLMGTAPVLPGFAISKTTAVTDETGAIVREFIQQKPDRGPEFVMPEAQRIKAVSAYVDGDNRIIGQWIKTEADKDAQLAAMRAAAEAFKDDLPREIPILAPRYCMSNLLSQYTVTDAHLGAMAWNLETGRGDYDLSIGERLLVDWFAAAIAASPPSKRAVFAQLGDFLHYDSFKSITPEHGHQLDADSRYPKMVRVAIRVVRRVLKMLLEKHEQVDVIMSDDNHSPVGEVWLREMFAVLYEDEPRLTVDTSPGTYNVVEHGEVSLFYHHGHRRGMKNLDSMFAGRFREVYGRTKLSYAHTGHKHADELKTTDLMKVEMHETIAAPDAYGSNWLSGRSAKVIHYHDKRGEVGRNIITAEMVMEGWA